MIGQVILISIVCWFLATVMCIAGYSGLHDPLPSRSDVIMCFLGLALMGVSSVTFLVGFVTWLLQLMGTL
jgi:hypothetical protein